MIRYYYHELVSQGENSLRCKTEQEILDEYWNFWHSRMVEKFGEDVVSEKYSEKDCIEDWMVVNWAWKVEEPIKLYEHQEDRHQEAAHQVL